jgi:hypothetical protein
MATFTDAQWCADWPLFAVQLSSINLWAQKAMATHVICTGNFGFHSKRRQQQHELDQFVKGSKRFNVPVYTVWGAQEDVEVVHKFRRGELQIANLFILDESNSFTIGSIRLFGLGGAVDHSRLLDSGEGNNESVAGENGRMWTTLLQVGELLEMASGMVNAAETRLLVTHASPFESPLITLLATELRADIVAYVLPPSTTFLLHVPCHPSPWMPISLGIHGRSSFQRTLNRTCWADQTGTQHRTRRTARPSRGRPSNSSRQCATRWGRLPTT